MKLLLVEDDENKRLQLLSFLNDVYPQVEVVVTRSLIGALRAAKEGQFRLVLLDMTLPNYDIGEEGAGGGMHAFGGEEFLRQIRRQKLNVPVIVVTQFETFGDPPDTKNLIELDVELRNEFPDLYGGAVYYHASIHDWVGKLADAMENAAPELRP